MPETQDNEAAVEAGINHLREVQRSQYTMPQPVGYTDNPVDGAAVEAGVKHLREIQASGQPGFFMGAAGALGRGVAATATPALLANAMAGQPGGFEQLALSERLRHGAWTNENAGIAEQTFGALLEGLPSMATDIPAAALGTVALGPLGTAAGFGASAGLRGASTAFLDAMREVGVDTSNPIALRSAVQSPEILRKAAGAAAKRGMTDAAFGAVVGYLLGPGSKLGEAIAQGTKTLSPARQMATKIGADAATLGAAGAAQSATTDIVEGRSPSLVNAGQATLLGMVQGPVFGAATHSVQEISPRAAKVIAWTNEDPSRIAAIAALEEPTRSAFERLGVPGSYSAEERASIHRAAQEQVSKDQGDASRGTLGEGSTDPVTTAAQEPTRAPEAPPRTKEVLNGEEAPQAQVLMDGESGAARQNVSSDVAAPDFAEIRSVEPVERIWEKDSWAPKELGDAARAVLEKPAGDPITAMERTILDSAEQNAMISTALREQIRSRSRETAPAERANNDVAASESDPSPARTPDRSSDAAVSSDATEAKLGTGPVRYPFVGQKTTAAESMSAPQIVRWMSRTFGVPIRYGKIAQRRALGIYKRWDQLVRLRGEEWANLEVASHEVSHDIDRKLGVANGNLRTYFTSMLPRAIRNDLGKLDYDPNERRPYEGFAEYVAATMHGHDLSARVPVFDKYFKETFLPQHPDIAAKLGELSNRIRNYNSQDPLQAVKAHISGDGQPREAGQRPFMERAREALSNFRDKAITQIFDTAHELYRFDRVAESSASSRGISLQGRTPTYQLAREAIRSGTSAGKRAFENGAHLLSDAGVSVIGPKYHDYVAAMGDADPADIAAFAVARHAIEARAAGVETGLRPADADAVYNRFKDDPRFTKAADIITQMNDALLDVAVDQKMIGPDDAAAMRQAWGKNYVPLYRVKDLDPSISKSIDTASTQAFSRRVGSGAEILDPMTATARKYAQIYQQAYLAQVKNSVIDTARKVGGMGWAAERLPTPEKATEFSVDSIKKQLKDAGVSAAALAQADPFAILRVFKPDAFSETDPNIFRRKEVTGMRVTLAPDGSMQQRPVSEWVNYKIDPDIAETTNALLQVIKPNMLARAFSVTNGIVRAFATTNNPAWALRNALKDAQTHFAQSDAAWYKAFAEIPREHLRAIKRVTGSEDAIADLYHRLRGETSLARAGKSVSDRDLIEMSQKQAPNVLAIAGRAFSHIKTPGEYIESIPRLAEFRRTLTDAGYSELAIRSGTKKPPADLVYRALSNAANVTVDFSNHGRDNTLRMVLFGNAMAQSIRAMGARFSSAERTQRTIGISAALMAMSAAYWVSVKDEDWYTNAPDWVKYGYFAFGVAGKPLVRIGVSQEWGAVHALTIAGLESTRSGNAAPLWGALVNRIQSYLASPALFGIIYQQATNRDAFNRPIETEAMKNLRPADRYNPSTSETSKFLGRVFGISPARTEHVLDSISSGLYRYAARSVESIVGASTVPKPAPLQARDVPIVGGFSFGGDPDKSEGAFYDTLQTQTEKVGSLKLRGATSGPEFEKLHELQWYKGIIHDMRTSIRDERDRDERFKVERYIIGLSRRANGEKEQLARYPDPLASRPDDPRVREAIDKAMAPVVMNATNPRPERTKMEPEEKYRARLDRWQSDRAAAISRLQSSYYSTDEIRDLLTAKVRKSLGSTQTIRDGQLTPFGKRMSTLKQISGNRTSDSVIH